MQGMPRARCVIRKEVFVEGVERGAGILSGFFMTAVRYIRCCFAR